MLVKVFYASNTGCYFPSCATRIIQNDESANLFAHEMENHHFFPMFSQKYLYSGLLFSQVLGCWQKVLFRPPSVQRAPPLGAKYPAAFHFCVHLFQRLSVSEAAAGTAQLSFYITSLCCCCKSYTQRRPFWICVRCFL